MAKSGNYVDISLALRRLAAAGICVVCASGCFFAGAGREKSVITSNDPSSKIPAIKKAAVTKDTRDTQTARQLVKSLDSDDPAVRFYAIRGLQSLTGETFGYVWYVDETDRRESTDQWNKWLDANAESMAGGELGRK